MDPITTVWPPKGRAAIIAWSGAGAAAVLGAVAAFVWPALIRPEPLLEAAGDQGVRINLVEPPKATPPRVGRLDVGLSEAALAMTNGRQALASAWSPKLPPTPAPTRRASTVESASTTPVMMEDDGEPPVQAEGIDDRWNRERDVDDRYEAAERHRWEAERLAQEERAERRAARRAERRQELERWDDRAAPRGDCGSPPPEDRPPPERW